MRDVETQTLEWTGERAFILQDGSGAQAWVVPAIGANCIAFQTPVRDQVAHILSTPASASVLRERPTFWGLPILAPYPGRHRTPFSWRGRQYAIEANDRPGVAIHGFVAGAPWEVIDSGPSRLICRFDSETVPDRAERWPWPFVLTATYSLERGALFLELELHNRADEEIPHLLGLHPYFPLRLTPARPLSAPLPTAADLVGDGAAAARETCLVWVAADELWEMKAGLGTGRIERLRGAWDLRLPKPVAELERTLGVPPGPGPFGDDAAVAGPRLPVLLYGKRAALRSVDAGTNPAEAGGVASGIQDAASGIEVKLDASAAFGCLALFCPPRQPFISLEPRSAVSDALTLMHDPRRLSTGVWPLAPGARWQAWVRLSAWPLRT
jgi:aldose 1-epimerase